MLNPFIKNIRYLIIYMAVWTLIIVAQTAILNYYLYLNVLVSFIDAAVFNIILALLGFNLWYAIKFNRKDNLGLIDLLINHLLAAIIMVALWLAAGYFILTAIESENPAYLSFLQNSLPWRAVIGFFSYLIFVLIYYMILNHEDLQQKLKVEAELNNLIREAELNALKSQINPHFLFNSLNSISSLTMTDPEKAQEMVIKLSDFMRYSLSYDRNETTSLRNELENTEKYLDIEKVRFGNRLNYTSQISEACLDAVIPNMILQPLFENAIKHGVYKSTEEVRIELRCEPKDEFIELRIINDFDPDASRAKGEGIGLKNIRKRLQLMYHSNELLQVKMGKIEFEVILRIPKTLPI